LDEAEAAVAAAEASTRQTHNWGDYSLALGALVCTAVARGDFAAAESRAQETLRMVARSRYPLGGALALPAMACAHALRGAWNKAGQALDTLLEPGRVFEEPGPVFQILAQTYRRLLRASSQAIEAAAVAESPPEPAALPWRPGRDGAVDITSLAPLCALIELGDLLAMPALTEQPYQALLWATDRGVLFSRGWMFLLPRVLGVAAMLNQRWDNAAAHFQAAIDAARRAGARPELGRAYLDYARLLAGRGSVRDRQQARALVHQAMPIFNALGMAPFVRRAAQLAEGLQARVPIAPGQRAAVLEHRSKPEVDILLRIARGRMNFLG
jgi:hypothetical protein